MVKAASLAAEQAMGTPQRGYISGVDERFVVLPLALTTTFLESFVDLGLSQALECPSHEQTSIRINDLNIADAGFGWNFICNG